MPKAAAATLSEQINPMAVKEVQLTDHTTTNNNEVTKTQVEPQAVILKYLELLAMVEWD